MVVTSSNSGQAPHNSHVDVALSSSSLLLLLVVGQQFQSLDVNVGVNYPNDVRSNFSRSQKVWLQDRLGWTFPGCSDGKASTCNAGDSDSIPGSGISPGEGNGNPLQYSCLENSMDGGAWWATVHGVTKSQTRLSDFPTTTSLLSSGMWSRY